MKLPDNIKNRISILLTQFETIDSTRKQLLNELADYIYGNINNDDEVNLVFICTHNSRRSQMAQIWAQKAAEHFNISNVFCYSGGTEVTAFNPRAVEALVKSGFRIEKSGMSSNPVYNVFMSDSSEPIKCFSKVYNDPFNPQNNFAAVMTCSEADKNCPVVFGAEKRFPVRYEDPKLFDNTESAALKYEERSLQIGTEMLYVFNSVFNRLAGAYENK